MKIAFFDAKEYDIEFFTRANETFGFEMRFFADRLDCDNADMASGFDAVCCFVNDRILPARLKHKGKRHKVASFEMRRG